MVGKIIVISGPMFSNKSYELIKKVNILKTMGHSVSTFKPPDRYDSNEIRSRNGIKLKCELLPTNKETIYYTQAFFNCCSKAIAIDEAQFYNDNLADAIEETAANYGITFVVSGLPRDFKNKPFGAMPKLLSLADEIIQTYAICNECKSEFGTRSVRITDDDAQIVLASDAYEVRCHKCVKMPNTVTC